MTGPAQLADEAAEAVRALNHATMPGAGGLVFPADAYEVTGALAVLAARLPQALAQLSAFLQAETDAGRIIIVAGEHAGDPGAAISVARCHLGAAVTAAGQLQKALDAAQNTLTWAAASSGGLAVLGGNGRVKRVPAGGRPGRVSLEVQEVSCPCSLVS